MQKRSRCFSLSWRFCGSPEFWIFHVCVFYIEVIQCTEHRLQSARAPQFDTWNCPIHWHHYPLEISLPRPQSTERLIFGGTQYRLWYFEDLIIKISGHQIFLACIPGLWESVEYLALIGTIGVAFSLIAWQDVHAQWGLSLTSKLLAWKLYRIALYIKNIFIVFLSTCSPKFSPLDIISQAYKYKDAAHWKFLRKHIVLILHLSV